MSLTRADGVKWLAPEQPMRRNERPMEIYVEESEMDKVKLLGGVVRK